MFKLERMSVLFSIVRYSFLLVYISTHSGCLSPSASGVNLLVRVEKLVENEEFGKALELIDEIEKGSGFPEELNSKKDKVYELATSYEKNIVIQGKSYLDENNWQQVLLHYELALKNYPQSKELQEEYSKLLSLQSDRIKQAERKLIFARGEMLEKEIVFQKELLQVDPKNIHLEKEIKTKLSDAKEVSEQLNVLALRAFEYKQLHRAQEMASLSSRLYPDGKADEILGAIKKQKYYDLVEKQKRIALANHKQLQKDKYRANRIVTMFDQSLTANNFVSAKKHLDELEKFRWRHPLLDDKKQIYQKRQAEYINKQIKQGYSFYKKEKFDKSLQIWRGVLLLQPDHKQAREYVDRVEKVIKNLEALQVKNTSTLLFHP